MMRYPVAVPDYVMHQARHVSARLENYMRIVDLRRMSHISCGATQESIESHTFPHKYKRVSTRVFFCTTLRHGIVWVSDFFYFFFYSIENLIMNFFIIDEESGALGGCSREVYYLPFRV